MKKKALKEMVQMLEDRLLNHEALVRLMEDNLRDYRELACPYDKAAATNQIEGLQNVARRHDNSIKSLQATEREVTAVLQSLDERLARLEGELPLVTP